MIIDRLKDIREDRDLKQSDIAKILNVTQAQYSRYELGVNIIPLDKVCTLAEYYSVSVDYLLGRTNVQKPYPRNELLPSKNKKAR